MHSPNVQFFVVKRDGTKQILWRYCASYADAVRLCKTLRVVLRAQRVWF